MRTVVIIVLILVLATFGLSSLFIVDQTQFAVQMRFGRPVRTLIEPGLYAKWPWPIETVERFDNRLMLLEQPGEGQSEKEYLTEDAGSGIGKNVVVSTYTCWRIKRSADSVLRFLETMRDMDSAAARLSDVVIAELGARLGRKRFLRAGQHRSAAAQVGPGLTAGSPALLGPGGSSIRH
jgi:membrane protease subunit HflC